MPSFPLLSRITAGICLTLAITIFIAPPLFFWLFHLEPSISAAVMARRAAVLFLAPGLLLWGLKDIARSDLARSAIARAMAVTMLALVLLGLSEFALGRVGPGIAIAVLTEAVLFWLWYGLMKDPQR
ncbi:hypothetical protein [Celeribacter persicus]|uniref:Uncharacterized protein n=1 Tax=Celeribacter persicus TaxID=1651082 RepID=A0A2T5H7M0_9RHOB|nr:hypothetical protein [Celeribacter persicus]PTQ67532.1 hypothetical protein C8N42_11825 [Celeribacter persicus]